MRSFLGFGQVPYIGAPTVSPVKFGSISGVTIPLQFNWIAYGVSTSVPNVNVLVEINSAVCAKLDQIRSVYIDNLGSNQPVYVYFPDSGTTIVCQPNAEGWFPAFTNARKFWVIAEGFLTGDVGSTVVALCNVPIFPGLNVELNQSVQLQKASPSITRGTSIYNSSFGVPALGDQIAAPGFLSLNTLFTQNIWGTPYASGFVVVTSMYMNVVNPGKNPAAFGIINIESTGAAGVLAPIIYALNPPFLNNNPAVQNILDVKGVQLKLDATQTWRLRNTVAADQGGCSFLSSFTYFPQ